MLVLSLDTTTRAGSSAILRDEDVACEQTSDASREQAERLPGELAALLERESVTLPEIDCFAVATGPGSFTGLRVGIATMQGLAMATRKPLIGVSVFDALAFLAGFVSAVAVPPGQIDSERSASARTPGFESRAPDPESRAESPESRRLVTWVDAWRGEVFAAGYAADGGVEEPTVGRPEDLLAGLHEAAILFTGDGASRHRGVILQAVGDRAGFTDPVVPSLAGAIARLARVRFLAGQRPMPHAIRPIYVRRSDAELARDAGRA